MDWKRAPSERARNRTGSELNPCGFIGKRKEVSKPSLGLFNPTQVLLDADAKGRRVQENQGSASCDL